VRVFGLKAGHMFGEMSLLLRGEAVTTGMFGRLELTLKFFRIFRSGVRCNRNRVEILRINFSAGFRDVLACAFVNFYF
jgi:hypothetical protein